MKDTRTSGKFARVCILGMGLIGGSLARALRHAGCCAEIVGFDPRHQRLREAMQYGVLDRGYTGIAPAVQGAGIVVVAAPVGAMASVFRSLAGCMAADTILTDVGSTKRSVVASAQEAFGVLPENFVPAHPLAGGEQSGVEHSRVDLFSGCHVILTPLPNSSALAVDTVRHLWQCTGATVAELDVDRHDEILGATSHLPHMLAYLLVDTLVANSDEGEIFRYAAGGFRDFTRIASSDPALWRDISLANGDVITDMLSQYGDALARLGWAISCGDRDAITAIFSRAKAARDQWITPGPPG